MEVNISLDVSNTEVLGVFGKGIHLLTHGYKITDESKIVNIEVGKSYKASELSEGTEDFECILVIPEKIYLQEWKKWIKGKKEYCERFNSYCGVMGYVYPDNPILIGKQTINRYNQEKKDYEQIELDVYKGDIFTGNPDFEHG
jgi:hypothetical protein